MSKYVHNLSWFGTFGSVCNDEHPLAYKVPKLAGSSEIDWRLVHPNNRSTSNLGRRPMQRGSLRKLFRDKFNSLSEDKVPRSIGIPSSNKLQLLSFSFLKQHNPEIEVGRNFMGSVHFADIHDKKLDIHDLEDCPLHLDNDTILSFFKRLKEYGSCLIAVLSASSSVKVTILPNCFGNLSIFMQSNKLRVSKDSKFEMLSGRFFNFSHLCKFNKKSFSKCPMDSCTTTKLVQPSSISISKCGTRKKFGDWVRNLEPLRLRTFNLLSTCQNRIK
jgi:hypothetical protein